MVSYGKSVENISDEPIFEEYICQKFKRKIEKEIIVREQKVKEKKGTRVRLIIGVSCRKLNMWKMSCGMRRDRRVKKKIMSSHVNGLCTILSFLSLCLQTNFTCRACVPFCHYPFVYLYLPPIFPI